MATTRGGTIYVYSRKNQFSHKPILYLRNNDEYPFANIHLITTLENPIGEKLIDTLSYTMATPDGEWLGKGLLVHESKLWFKEAYRFRVIGEHRLTVKLCDTMIMRSRSMYSWGLQT